MRVMSRLFKELIQIHKKKRIKKKENRKGCKPEIPKQYMYKCPKENEML